MTRSDSPRKFALGIYLSLLFAMFSFTLLAGHPNQGLLALSMAGRVIFAMGAAAGIVLSPYLLNSPRRDERLSQQALRFSISFVVLATVWSLACFGSVHRLALLLDGPVSREAARLQRPLSAGPPLWCSYYTTVHTESGLTGSLCMERIARRSEFFPLLGCVALDTPVTLQITRTFLGPVGSLVEIVDVGRCAKRGSKQ